MQSRGNIHQNRSMRQKRRPRKIIKVQVLSGKPKNYSSARLDISSTDDQRRSNLFVTSDEHWGKDRYNSSSVETASDQQRDTRKANYKIFKDISMDFSSFTKTKRLTKEKKKIHVKNIAFAIFLILLVAALIVIPIVIVYQLSPTSQSPNPCASSRTLTFDDIGTNPFWIGASGYGAIPAGYGGFIWQKANYLNVSVHSVFGTPLVSGGYVAYIDTVNTSNILSIRTNDSAQFYLCSFVTAAAQVGPTSFILSGILSNTIVYTLNISINSTTPSALDFTNRQIAIDKIQMFAYGRIFSFDNLVVSGP